MINIDEIKKLSKEHDNCLKKIKVINYANKESIWMKVSDARGGSFYLEDDEIELLHEFIEKKGLKIENEIQGLFNNSNRT